MTDTPPEFAEGASPCAGGIPLVMGRIRRHGYVLEWFIGDHTPRHVHVYDAKGRFIGRFDLDAHTGLEGWIPARKLLKLIQELQKQGRL